MPRPDDELRGVSKRFPRRIAAAGGRVTRRIVGLTCAVGVVLSLVGQGAVAGPAMAGASVPAASPLPGSVVRMVLQPARVSTVVHQSVTYTALGFATSGLPLGNVNAIARFSISPEGSCTQNLCRAEKPGVHRVIAETDKGGHVVRSTALLDIMPMPEPAASPSGATQGTRSDPTNQSAPYKAPKPSTSAKTTTRRDSASSSHRGTAVKAPNSQRLQASGQQVSQSKPTVTSLPRLVITPGRKFVIPGERTAYVVVAFDASGKPLGVVTSRAKLSITFGANGKPTARPDGSCSANVCVAAKLGRHTIWAVVVIGGTVVKARADLQVVPKHRRPHPIPGLAAIEIRPSEAAIESGGVMEYFADGFDANHRLLGDVTSRTRFTIKPDGSCTDNRCTATDRGTHTVTGTVRATKSRISDTGTLVVTPAIGRLDITPDSATVEVGDSVSYTAYGRDTAGRIVAVLTDITSFSMNAPDGCKGPTCTPTEVGLHEVTGTATVGGRVLIDTARLRAIPAIVALDVRPAEATTRVNRGVKFTAYGIDSQGRSVVDLTDETTFTTQDPARCTRSTCQSPTTGDFTVTGVVDLRGRTLSDTAVLHVTSGITGLELEPSSRTITAGSSVSYVAWGLDADRRRVVNLTDVTDFRIDKSGSCTDATCTATTAQTYTVTGTVTVEEGIFSATASLDVVPASIDRLDVVPPSARTTAGESKSFQAFASDAFGNRIGEVTPDATFSMQPPGSCTESACMSTKAGEHTVTASVVVGRRIEGTAILVVTPGPLAKLVLNPARTSVAAGTDATFRASGSDIYDNPIDEVTRSTTFTIDPPGTCTDSACRSTKAQTYEVTGEATVDGRVLTGTALLDVLPGLIDTLTLTPPQARAKAGEGVKFGAQGADAYGNDVGNVTDRTTFTITDDGTCTVDGTCSGKLAKSYTVTGSVPSGTRTVTGTAVLDVVAGPAKGLVLDPPYALAMSGAGVTYHAYSTDNFGNRLDDVTTSTKLSIGPNGSCDPAATCSATALGPHTVTGTADLGPGPVTATADVLVLSVEIVKLRLNPYAAHIRPGQDATYVAVGLDREGGAVSNLTHLTTFSVTRDGSCQLGRNVCTAQTPGTYTVTGTVPISTSTGTGTGTVTGIVTGDATLEVDNDDVRPLVPTGEIVRIELTPKTAKADVGVGVPYHAMGFDADGHEVRDVTSLTTFTIDGPHASCDARGTCVATTPGAHTVTGTYGGVTAGATGGIGGSAGGGTGGPTVGPTIGTGGGTAASRSRTSDGLSVSRSLLFRTTPKADPTPSITATASLSVTQGSPSCFAIASTDAQSLDATPTPGSDTTTVSVTGTFATRFAKCKVVILVEGQPVAASTPIGDNGSFAATATVSSDPDRDVKVTVTRVDNIQVLRQITFTIPPASGSNWPLWLVLGLLILVAAGTIGTADRHKRQRRWVTQHVNVQPVPAHGDISAGQEHEDDPATKSHTVHLEPHTEPGSITVTEEDDR